MITLTSSTEALKHLMTSYRELQQHSSQSLVGGPEYPECELRLVDMSDALNVQMWWHRISQSGEQDLLWDAFTIEPSKVAENFLGMLGSVPHAPQPVGMPGSSHILSEPEVSAEDVHSHPRRYWKYQPMAQKLSMSALDGDVHSFFQPQNMELVQNLMMDLEKGKSEQLPIREQIKSYARWRLDALSAGLCFGEYVRGGRRTYDFSAWKAPVDISPDIRLKDLKLPARAVYIKLWPISTHIDSGWIPDGVYVQKNEEGPLQLFLTCRPLDVSKLARWPAYPEPGAFISTETSPDIRLREALPTYLSSRLERLRKEITKSHDKEDVFRMALQQAALQAQVDTTTTRIVDKTSDNAQAELSRFDSFMPVWASLTDSLCLALAKLSEEPESFEMSWSPSVPRDIQGKLDNGTAVEKEVAESLLVTKGYDRFYRMRKIEVQR